MNYSDILQARKDAQEQINLADQATRGAAQLCAGRLRKAEVWEDTLRMLKRELRDFDMTTGKWKDAK